MRRFEKDHPALYEIGLASSGIGLKLSAHESLVDALDVVTNSTTGKLTPFFQKQLSLPAFISSGQPEWGYGKVLHEVMDQRAGWKSWECSFPKGSRRLEHDNFTRMYAISATLNIFFGCSDLVHEETDEENKQLIAVSLLTERNQHGCEIFGGIYPQMSRWLASEIKSYPKIDDRRFGTIHRLPLCKNLTEQMIAAYTQLEGQKITWKESFRTWITPPKYIFWQCLGDACDMGHEMSDTDDNVNLGYSISSHNCDNPQQQLTLLIGAAVLHDAARKAGF